MTSNIGSEFIDKMSGLGFGSGASVTANDRYDQTKEKVMNSLKDFFRPEFLNRLDEIILFNILSPEVMKDIVRMQVEIVAKRLADKRITLTFSEAALENLGKEGCNPQYGARPLKRLIQTKILTPIANLMVARGVLEGGSIKVDFAPSTTAGMTGGEYKFDVRKGPERVHTARSRAAAARA